MALSAARDQGCVGCAVPVTYRGEDGGLVSCPELSDACGVAFERRAPVGRVAAFKGQRSFAGLWWCASTSSHVPFGSWVERDQLMVLDFAPDVVAVAARPFRVRLTLRGGPWSHTPSYFARLRDGGALVVDARGSRPTGRALEVCAALSAACDLAGWRYERRQALDPAFAANLRWLAGYRHPRCRNAWVAEQVLETARSGESTWSIGGLAQAMGDPTVVLPTVFHLLWAGKLAGDLSSSVLRLSSTVRAVARHE